MTLTLEKWPGFMPGLSERTQMETVIFKKGTFVKGKRYNPDDKKPVEVNEADARILIGSGHAVPFENREADIDVESPEAKDKGKNPAPKGKK